MHTFLYALPLLAATALAQEEPTPEAPPKPDPQICLAEAIQKMRLLPSVEFRTTEAQDSSTSRQVRRQLGGMGGLGGGGDTEVHGSWSDGILQARLNDDADEILAYRGRMIARGDDSDWKLRHRRLVNGQEMPFVLDPSRFFEALTDLPKNAVRVRHSEETAYKGQDLLLVGVTLTDEHAQEFALSGALPWVQTGMGGVRILGGLGAAGMGRAPLPDLTIDLALYLDPKTGFVHRAQCRVDRKGGGNGGVQIQIGGAGGMGGLGGGEEEKEEEVKEKDEQGNRIYKRGLPVRKLRETISRLDYDIRFTKHGMPVPHKLDERARKLLRIGQ